MLPYLHDLGVDWVYLSPLLAAESHSNHGYDVSDHGRIDADPGRRAPGLAAVSSEAHRLGMGVLVDIVPNHVGVASASDNAWWWSVLTHGRSPPSTPRRSTSTGPPVAGGSGSRSSATTTSPRTARSPTCAIEAGQLLYHDNAFPLAPGSADNMDEHGSPRRTCTPGSTTSWCPGGWPTPASTTAGSSPSTAWPRSASRTASGSTARTTRSAAGSARAWSTASGSTTPTACATPRATSATSPT